MLHRLIRNRRRRTLQPKLQASNEMPAPKTKTPRSSLHRHTLAQNEKLNKAARKPHHSNRKLKHRPSRVAFTVPPWLLSQQSQNKETVSTPDSHFSHDARFGILRLRSRILHQHLGLSSFPNSSPPLIHNTAVRRDNEVVPKQPKAKPKAKHRTYIGWHARKHKMQSPCQLASIKNSFSGFT